MNKFNTGDFVFVINWGIRYQRSGGGNSVFWEREPVDWMSDDHCHTTIIYNKISPSSGKEYKDSRYWTVKEKIEKWRNYKYQIQDWMYHPNNEDQVVYLLKSEEGHVCEVGETGLATITKEQYDQKEFDGLVEYHRGKWTLDMIAEEKKVRWRNKNKAKFPDKLLKKVYDKNDNVLFGSNMTKGKVIYEYIPAKFTANNVPFIIGTSILYDGEGNTKNVDPSDILTWQQMKEKFTDNDFAN